MSYQGYELLSINFSALFSACSITSRSPGPLSLMPHRWRMPCMSTRYISLMNVVPCCSALVRTVSTEMIMSPLSVSPSQ